MKIGIVAEGPDDIEIIKQVVKCLKSIDTSDMIFVRPRDAQDETDNSTDKFSNWELVLNEASEHVLIDQFFEQWGDDEPAIVIHIDTAERGKPNYDVTEPQRTGQVDFVKYSAELRENVKTKIEGLLPAQYRQKVAYAIAIEETEAWIIPLFENSKKDTSHYTDPKGQLESLISKDKALARAYVDTQKKRLNAVRLGKLIGKRKNLRQCRENNTSLELFCLEVEGWK